MGTVFRARDRETGALVALKTLAASDDDAKRRFLRESTVLAALDHVNIVRHVAYGIDDGRPYLVMEWLEGEDLAETLRRGPLSVERSLEVLAKVAAALAAAHAQGIVHRDVKPSNVVCCEGAVKVVDFGIARARAPTRILTASGTGLGTLGYMAPEQIRGERDLTPAVDVF